MAEILARLAPVDLVLVEGYKRDTHPKIEVFRAEAGHALIQPTDPFTRAVATDTDPGALPVPVLDLNDTEAVAEFILHETGLLPASPFDTVVVVDWSASASPSPARPSKDAIWIGVARAGADRHQLSPHPPRGRSLSDRPSGRRGHRRSPRPAGVRLSHGLPAGFAARLTGQPQARAVWDWLDRHITDAPDNANNRFAVADQINACFHQPGPFWGRPDSAAHAHLAPVKPADYPGLGLAERRHVETLVPRPSRSGSFTPPALSGRSR